MSTVESVVEKMRATGGVGNGFQVVTPMGLELGADWKINKIVVHSAKSVDDARQQVLHGAIDERGRVWLFVATDGTTLDIGRVRDRGATERQHHALDTLRKAAGRSVKVSNAS
jgi:phosphoribosylformylglycinamidine (FGAM) synthase-like amidotransferase family enzyme